MGRTKKVKITGKYGVRYGKGVKEKVLKVEEVQRKKHVCPNCMKPSLKRVAAGIWQCKKCRFKFAGKAYKPS